MKISILGAGNMGTALAKMLSENDHKVILWSIEPEVVREINEMHKNSKYMQGFILKKEVAATGDLKEALKSADLIVFSVPSNIVRNVSEQISKLITYKPIIVNTAKGIEDVTNERMSEIINEYVKNPVVTIAGPSIANEIALKTPTYAVFASSNSTALNNSVSAFKNEYYNISTSSDITGVEWCSALKNVIAIAAGIVDGLGYGDNTKAGIITKGLEELSLIVESVGGKKETAYSLAGIGDLIVTCSSMHSRNRRFGEKIAKGLNVEEAIRDVGQTVEGLNMTKVIKKVIDKKRLNCPLISRIYRVLFENENAKKIL